MIASGCIEKLEISTWIDIGGGLTKVAFATEVSVVAACPCAVDGLSLTVALEAVTTPLLSGPTAANRHLKRRAEPGRKALDVAKNRLQWKARKCVNLTPKTGQLELAIRRGSLCPRRSVHDRFRVYREARNIYENRHRRRSHQGGICYRGVCSRGMSVRSGWVHVNGRGLYLRGPERRKHDKSV